MDEVPLGRMVVSTILPEFAEASTAETPFSTIGAPVTPIPPPAASMSGYGVTVVVPFTTGVPAAPVIEPAAFIRICPVPSIPLLPIPAMMLRAKIALPITTFPYGPPLLYVFEKLTTGPAVGVVSVLFLKESRLFETLL